MTWVALVLAGGLGAWLRSRTDTFIRDRSRATVPLGTWTINMIGSFLLALLVGSLLNHPELAGLQSVIGTGLLGGFTTFSTATVELVNLADQGRRRAAFGLAAAMVTGGLLVGAAGLLLGSRL